MRKAEALERIRTAAEKVKQLQEELLDLHVDIYRDSLLDEDDYAKGCVTATDEAFCNVREACISIWCAVPPLNKAEAIHE